MIESDFENERTILLTQTKSFEKCDEKVIRLSEAIETK